MPSTIDTQQQAEIWAAQRLLSRIRRFSTQHGIFHLIGPRILGPLQLSALEQLGSDELEIVESHLQRLTLYRS